MVIKIEKECERILPFLYPTYECRLSMKDGYLVNKAICRHNVTSVTEHQSIDYYYPNSIIISDVIFDKEYDTETIASEVIKYAHDHMKSRRTKFFYDPKKVKKEDLSEFISDCIDFMFGIPHEEETFEISELFQKLGTNQFVRTYLKLAEKYPPSSLSKSVFTFLSKVDKDSPNLMHKKFALMHAGKIHKNINTAAENFQYYSQDEYGLNYVKFFTELLT